MKNPFYVESLRPEQWEQADIEVHDGDGGLEWTPGSPLGEVGLNLDLAVFSESAFRRLAETRGFVFWEFAQAEIVHDPAGIAGRNQRSIRDRFNAHPEAEAVWREFMAAVARNKWDANVTLPHGGREGVEQHLERMRGMQNGS
jgi:hypothetical protein